MENEIKTVAGEITRILGDNKPSIYLYGSAVMDDFRLGWSDIDILALTPERLSHDAVIKLVQLRQTMQSGYGGESLYRCFEGAILSLDAFLTGKSDIVVYWGTRGQQVTNHYRFDSFSMAQLLEKGRLLAGEDIRDRMTAPTAEDFRRDVRAHYDTIRKVAVKTDRSFYSFGWLLDIARCIYTLREGVIIAKTAAGRRALEEGLCPVPEALEMALKVREEPLKYRGDEAVLDHAETLGPAVQRFADVLEKELKT